MAELLGCPGHSPTAAALLRPVPRQLPPPQGSSPPPVRQHPHRQSASSSEKSRSSTTSSGPRASCCSSAGDSCFPTPLRPAPSPPPAEGTERSRGVNPASPGRAARAAGRRAGGQGRLIANSSQALINLSAPLQPPDRRGREGGGAPAWRQPGSEAGNRSQAWRAARRVSTPCRNPHSRVCPPCSWSRVSWSSRGGSAEIFTHTLTQQSQGAQRSGGQHMGAGCRCIQASPLPLKVASL